MHGKWALLEPDSTTLSSLLPLDSLKRPPKPPTYDGLFDNLSDGQLDDSEEKNSISELELSTAFISRVNEAKKVFAWHVLLPVDTKGDLNDSSNNKVDVGAYWWSSAPKDDRPHWELQRLWIEFKKDAIYSIAYSLMRRHDRTGTWQFMSAHILNDMYRPPSIQDELESFLHVLLYYAIRYTHCANGEYKCGGFKRRIMKNGVATLFGDEDTLITFGDPTQEHPLNSLIRTLLQWFGAYYRVVKHDKPPPQPTPYSSSSSSSGSSRASTPPTGTLEYDRQVSETRMRNLRNFALTTGGSEPKGGNEPVGGIHQEETIAADRRDAAFLNTHSAMCDLLEAHLQITARCGNELSRGTKRGSDVLEDDAGSSNKCRKKSPLAGPYLQS
ncbi:hypothetical protein A0H81_06278 [Grifola frondosa]|uniref:Fungal-type protein kinase domain-containing protein n=1 Tax=Grifola frondosa TaxID=5627 RepID=A0A1C7MB68_GRIFR|nr:hypothetical protein A0H81_06278 [Grifola frondosa]